MTNSSIETPLGILAERQSRRYWVERALEDAKGIGGLDQYRVTGWVGWHHHTSMVLLAMLYLQTLRENFVEEAEKMTLKDALWLVEAIVPRKKLSYEETLEIIKENNRNREKSRLSRLSKSKAEMEVE